MDVLQSIQGIARRGQGVHIVWQTVSVNLLQPAGEVGLVSYY
jgi:hypothetical protein